MPQRPYRMYLLAGALLLCMAGLILRLMRVQNSDHVSAVGTKQGSYHLTVPLAEGIIYDRNMKPINQPQEVIKAVVAPTPDTIASIFAKLRDPAAVSAQLTSVKPFVCELTEDAQNTPHLQVLHGRTALYGRVAAQHLIGYRQNGAGVAGLEAAYGDWLKMCDSNAEVTFTVSAFGEVLAGGQSSVVIPQTTGGGVVTTLDLPIQQIAEAALAEVSPLAGAAVILDCKTGDILASASLPVYDTQHLADALDDPRAPFLNRALQAYPVGSVFKLAVAAAALESGRSARYCWDCDGQIDISGQVFRCHCRTGHGLLDMEGAMVESCNPYFISLSRIIPTDTLYDTARALGFGQAVRLADGVTAAAGNLPDTEALSVEAEKANLAFGQGKLLATPIQVAAMTACIANDGIYSTPRLVVGETLDGIAPLSDTASEQRDLLTSETAAQLREMMTAVLADENHANGRPSNTTAGGKTSTAQTGQFDDDGKERCHAWMTGFFPADDPQYAVTVMIENGGSGNETAAPVFRRIIEEITRIRS